MKRQHSVEVYRDTVGEYRSRVVHKNGNIILDSGEGYKTISKCLSAIQRFLDDTGENVIPIVLKTKKIADTTEA